MYGVVTQVICCSLHSYRFYLNAPVWPSVDVAKQLSTEKFFPESPRTAGHVIKTGVLKKTQLGPEKSK